MRLGFAMVFTLLIIALIICSHRARLSGKKMGGAVGFMEAALVPPMIGNLMLIASGTEWICTLGRYIYFLGMDLAMFALLRFTLKYCGLRWKSKGLKMLVYGLLIADAVQLLCNPIFGHAFSSEVVVVDGAPYYKLIPFAGQTFHRVVDYGIMGGVLIVFFLKMMRSPQIYMERYSVIFITMIIATVWQTFYIFSRAPIDRSMIGFAVFGLLVYYFALHYRPMRLMDQMLAGIASDMKDALFFFDAGNRCIWANPSGIKMTGIQEETFETVPEKLRNLIGDFQDIRDNWSSRQVVNISGEQRHLLIEKHSVLDKHKRKTGSFLSVRDNTEEENALYRKIYNATHDSLTGLYTREFLYEQSREMMNAHPDRAYLMIYLDVNEFKLINDVYGSEFGDLALRQIADMIRRDMTKDCVYGRLSGDTFGICMPAEVFARARIENQVSSFVIRDGKREHQLLIHLGIYEVTEAELEISAMFDRAHMALSTIKDNYHVFAAYYDDAMRESTLWSQHVSSELKTALAQRQVRPYLQPLVDRDGHVIGAEALVRWIHPKDGFLSPGLFIPVFEKNGMIADVDRYMWRSACEILAKWQKEGRKCFISVNVSPKDFFFMDVAEEFRQLIREFKIDPTLLRIEITETVMMTDAINRIGMLNCLKRDGFIIEMDDFGSGYSSLNMLQDLPVDVLKIDMMFLRKTQMDQKGQTILQDVISMSDDLGIIPLTEGVETEEQFRMLAEMGCRIFQGFYFSKPVPLDEFETFAFSRKP